EGNNAPVRCRLRWPDRSSPRAGRGRSPAPRGDGRSCAESGTASSSPCNSVSRRADPRAAQDLPTGGNRFTAVSSGGADAGVPGGEQQVSMSGAYPGLDEVAARAAGHPRGASEEALALPQTLPEESAPEFLDRAARVFAARGLPGEAGRFFGRARELEEARARSLGLPLVGEEAHRTFVELAPSGAVGGTELCGHLRRLAQHPEPGTAHRWAREAVCAVLGSGVVPADFVPEPVRVAWAARLDEKTEKRFVADRLLREGLMPRAPLPVGADLEIALRDAAADDDELFDLLLAARPEPGPDTAPEPRARYERRWRLLGGRGTAAAARLVPGHRPAAPGRHDGAGLGRRGPAVPAAAVAVRPGDGPGRPPRGPAAAPARPGGRGAGAVLALEHRLPAGREGDRGGPAGPPRPGRLRPRPR